MVQKIMGIARVQRADNYNPNNQSFEDKLKKKQEFTFKNILETKMEAKNNKPQEAYRIDLNSFPR